MLPEHRMVCVKHGNTTMPSSVPFCLVSLNENCPLPFSFHSSALILISPLPDLSFLLPLFDNSPSFPIHVGFSLTLSLSLQSFLSVINELISGFVSWGSQASLSFSFSVYAVPVYMSHVLLFVLTVLSFCTSFSIVKWGGKGKIRNCMTYDTKADFISVITLRNERDVQREDRTTRQDKGEQLLSP